MAANTPMGRLDSVEQSAIEGLLGLDASKLSALAGKKAELLALVAEKENLLALAAKAEELLALVEPDEPAVEGGGE